MQSTSASPFWRSKTFWANAVALLSLLIPSVAEWVKSNPVDCVAALTAINVIIKFITHGQSAGWASKLSSLIDEIISIFDCAYPSSPDEEKKNQPDATSKAKGKSTEPGTDPCPGTVDKTKLSGLGLLALIGISGMAAMSMAACGYQVTADEAGLTITRDGKTITIHRGTDKQGAYAASSSPVIVIPVK